MWGSEHNGKETSKTKTAEGGEREGGETERNKGAPWVQW